MTRLIDADSVYKWYLEAFKGQIKPNEIHFSMNDIRYNLQNIPTIDAVPARHGKWIFGNDLGHAWMKCSECCKSQDGQTLCFTYCPNCGAMMIGEE